MQLCSSFQLIVSSEMEVRTFLLWNQEIESSKKKKYSCKLDIHNVLNNLKSITTAGK